MARYRVLVGLNYRPQGDANEKRAEPGDIRDDIPERSVKWLLRDGYIEPATERSPAKKAARTKEVHAAAEAAEQPADIPDRLEEGEE